MTLRPREFTAAPSPGPLRYGLFSVAPPKDLPSAGRGGGLVFTPDTCGIARPYAMDCPPGGEKTFDEGDAESQALPFVVLATLLCGAVGYTDAEWAEKAQARLATGEQGAAELALWTGRTAAGGADSLGIGAFNTFGAPTVVTAVDDSSIASVVSELEEFAYLTSGYGYEAVIHAPVGVAAHAGEANLVIDDGGVKRTPYGTRWVFGGGYPGTTVDTVNGDTPGTIPAGGVAMYVTGQVNVWRSPDVFVPPRVQTLDRTTNQQFMVAERDYAISFDCLLGQATYLYPAGGS